MESAEVNDNIPRLLEGEFWIQWCSHQEFGIVRITPTSVVCIDLPEEDDASPAEQTRLVLQFQDIIGCRCSKKGLGDDEEVCLNIFAFPVKKLTNETKYNVRDRQTLIIVFDNHESNEQNEEEAMRWKHLIDSQVMKISPRIAIDDIYKSRRMLVLVNPFSGAGKAPEIFKDQVLPMLNQSGIDFKMILTKRAGHCMEIAETLDPHEWYGIVAVSGDGLLFELLNGFMKRGDWKEAIKVPIGIIPGGSGNAMSASILHAAGEAYQDNHAIQASYVLSKHSVRSLDLTAIDTSTGERLYACSSISWGLVSDVDIDSERWRFLGSSRFLLEALTKILYLKQYKGRLSFLPVDDWDATAFFQLNEKRGVKLVGDNSLWPTYKKQPEKSVNNNRKEIIKRKEENIPAISTPGNNNLKPINDLNFVNHDNTSDIKSSSAETKGTKSNEYASSATSEENSELPKLADPLPSNWLSFEDEFVLVLVCMISHLTEDTMTSPYSKLNDGKMHLVFVRAGVSRLGVLHILDSVKTGKHLEYDRCEVIPARAFRLEPFTPNGHIAVDGEVVSYGPIQGRVLPGLARVMAM